MYMYEENILDLFFLFMEIGHLCNVFVINELLVLMSSELGWTTVCKEYQQTENCLNQRQKLVVTYLYLQIHLILHVSLSQRVGDNGKLYQQSRIKNR